MAPRLPSSPCCLHAGRCIGAAAEATVRSTTQTRRAIVPLAKKASFSTTGSLERRLATNITKQRRVMFAWFDRMKHLKHLPERMEDQKRRPGAYKVASQDKDKDKKKDEDKAAGENEDQKDEKDKRDEKDKGGVGRGRVPRHDELIQGPQYATGSATDPFQSNGLFKSEPVLDDESREMIWSDIIQKNEPIKIVSAKYGVDIRRVAAVARLKQVEKEWIKQAKPLASNYGTAVLSVLPTHQVKGSTVPFESIHDVAVHRYTMQQLFWPVAESKQFTREDAAKAFNRYLLPADKRVPIPEVVELEKGANRGENRQVLLEKFRKAVTDHESDLAERRARKAEREARRITKVETKRFEFRFQMFQVEDVGKDGRSKRGTGWRYGVPLYDRQRGHSLEVPDKVGQ